MNQDQVHSNEVPLALQVQGLSHSFATTKVLEDVSFDLREGEIHSLVGENGAGKSTLMKIIFGLLQPLRGKISLGGRELKFAERHSQIGMVHQHMMLASELTPLEHVLLDQGTQWQALQLLPKQKVFDDLQTLSQETGMPVPWNEKVGNLSVGIAQRVEILRLLYSQAKILIFDEPTAVLSPVETQELLKRLLHFKKRGHSIILISHKLKEVLQVSDRITVLRKGKIVGNRVTSEWNLSELGEAMIGRRLQPPVAKSRNPKFLGMPAMEMKRAEDGFQMSLEKGEILGIAGVEGNGQEWLVEALLRPRETLKINDAVFLSSPKPVSTGHMSTAEIRQLGVGFLADDRHSKSVLLNSDLSGNFVLGTEDLWSRHGFLQWPKVNAQLMKAKEDFAIQFASLTQVMGELSGGNQQKIVVARETQRKLSLLIAHQPTRGVDIGAMELIHRDLLRLRSEGAAILLISSDLDELLQLSDRLVVLFAGKINGTWSRDELTSDPQAQLHIGAAMGGRGK